MSLYIFHVVLSHSPLPPCKLNEENLICSSLLLPTSSCLPPPTCVLLPTSSLPPPPTCLHLPATYLTVPPPTRLTVSYYCGQELRQANRARHPFQQGGCDSDFESLPATELCIQASA
eukprot:747253-Hanusia_phi.AAC.4